MKRPFALGIAMLLAAAAAHAQTASRTSGTTIVISANGEVTRANDEARATFAIEEQDKDKSAAASRVNQKMKEGVETLKRGDPQAKLRTRGYYTYPVYDDGVSRPANTKRQILGWRVGQYVDLTTTNLAALPATVAAAQRILTLNGVYFGLARATQRDLDRELIEATYRNLNERIGFTVHAMGRDPNDAVLDTVDFEGSGNYAPQQRPLEMKAMSAARAAEPQPVEEPSFEPGETTLQMRLVGRVKLR